MASLLHQQQKNLQEEAAYPQVDQHPLKDDEPITNELITNDRLRGELPPETVMGVLSFLAPKDLAIVARLSPEYLSLANDDMLWKPLCLRWGIDNPNQTGWKAVMKRALLEQKRAEEQASKRCWHNTRYSRTQYGQYKKGEVIIMKGRPCKITDMSVSRPGKHGAAKIYAIGLDIFTGQKTEEIFRNHTAAFPLIIRTDYIVYGVDVTKEGEAELLNEAEGTERTIAVPEGELGDKIRELWNSGVEFSVTVTEASWNLPKDEDQKVLIEAITAVNRKD